MQVNRDSYEEDRDSYRGPFTSIDLTNTDRRNSFQERVEKTFFCACTERLHKLATLIFSYFVVFTGKILNHCYFDDELLAFYATYKGKVTLLKALAAIGVDIKAKTSLLIAVNSRKNAEQTVPILIKCGANVNVQEKDSTGNTPLHYAVQKKNKAVINILLENGANPDIVNNDRKTAAQILDPIDDAATIRDELAHFTDQRAYRQASEHVQRV